MMECMENEKDSTSSSTTGVTNVSSTEEFSPTITKQVTKSDKKCTQGKKSHPKHRKRKSILRSSSSAEYSASSATEGEDDNSDKDYSEGRLTNVKMGNVKMGVFPSSQWKYADLKALNIFYNETSLSLKEFMQDVKTVLLKNHPHIPDVEKYAEMFSSLTKDNLLFSFCLDTLENSIYSKFTASCVQTILKEDFARAKETDKNLDLRNSRLERYWLFGVQNFLTETLLLFHTLLFPMKEDESLTRKEEFIKVNTRKRKHREMKHEESREKRQPSEIQHSESVYQHYCEAFGRLFFLEKKAAVKRNTVIGDKIVNTIPDITYPFTPLRIDQDVLDTMQKDSTLLFVVEVKGKSLKNASSNCLEEQLDSYVLGQVGSELFAEAPDSAMFPCSLGMICIETTIIFVFLKMKIESAELPLQDKGIIHYTRPFDILKKEDRGEIFEFMYWLGCIQNRFD